MSRTLITEYAWGYHFDPGTNIVDVVINHLRKKVDAKHGNRLITTVRGVGYMIKDEKAGGDARREDKHERRDERHETPVRSPQLRTPSGGTRRGDPKDR